MDYDFSGLCADQLEKLKKRLEALHKSFVKEYELALRVINNPEMDVNVMVQSVRDLLHDQANKCEIFYNKTFNQIQQEFAFQE